MKEKREYQLKVRLTETEKEQLQNYAAAHNVSLSELVRKLIYAELSKEDKE